MKKSNGNGLQKRKLNIFLLFLVCSFLAWFISKLSETYTQNSTFDLVYINIPDSLKLANASRKSLDIQVRASGFQLLGFNFKTRKIELDLSDVSQNQSGFYLTQLVYRRQIERQLFQSMTLLEVDNDTLYFDMYKVYKKEVPVRADIDVQLGQNYLLDGGWKITPPKITITGPRKEISKVEYVATAAVKWSGVDQNISRQVALAKAAELKNTVYSTNSVLVTGEVFRFSEKVFNIPVEVSNLPEGTQVKTFPNTIAVLCKGRMENLKNLTIEDFKVMGDYSKSEEDSAFLEVQLTNIPENVHSAQLMESRVEFLLKRE